jgi:hypothetical protein
MDRIDDASPRSSLRKRALPEDASGNELVSKRSPLPTGSIVSALDPSPQLASSNVPLSSPSSGIVYSGADIKYLRRGRGAPDVKGEASGMPADARKGDRSALKGSAGRVVPPRIMPGGISLQSSNGKADSVRISKKAELGVGIGIPAFLLSVFGGIVCRCCKKARDLDRAAPSRPRPATIVVRDESPAASMQRRHLVPSTAVYVSASSIRDQLKNVGSITSLGMSSRHLSPELPSPPILSMFVPLTPGSLAHYTGPKRESPSSTTSPSISIMLVKRINPPRAGGKMETAIVAGFSALSAAAGFMGLTTLMGGSDGVVAGHS